MTAVRQFPDIFRLQASAYAPNDVQNVEPFRVVSLLDVLDDAVEFIERVIADDELAFAAG